MIIKSDSPAVTIPEVTVTEYILHQLRFRTDDLARRFASAD